MKCNNDAILFSPKVPDTRSLSQNADVSCGPAVPQNLQIMRDPSVSSFSPSADNIIHHKCSWKILKLYRQSHILTVLARVSSRDVDLSMRLHASRILEYIYKSRDVFVHARSNHVEQFAVRLINFSKHRFETSITDLSRHSLSLPQASY